MATRSTIALEFTDGTVSQVYCHWDGYLSHNGEILEQHYKDPFKLQQLIDLGDLSVLGEEIGVKRPFDNPHKYGSSEYREFEELYKNQCVFYNRDRGEDMDPARKFKDFEDYKNNFQGEEYNYILRQVDGQPVWFVEFHGCDSGFVSMAEAFDINKELNEA